MTPTLALGRRVINGVMLSLTGVCTVVVIGVLFFILGYITYHGIAALNWDFFTKLPKPVGETSSDEARSRLHCMEHGPCDRDGRRAEPGMR